jgi:hypothetical protein
MSSLAPTGGGFTCGTLVWTDKGPVPIEQIKVGDQVLSRPADGGAPAYRAVTRTLVVEDREFFGITYVDGTKPNSSFILYPTGDQRFWIEGVGWNRVDRWGDAVPDGGTRFQLRDARAVSVMIVSPVYRTAQPRVGWYNTSMYLDDIGFEVDFSGNPEYLDFDATYPDEMEEPDPYLKIRVYNLEVEEFHTYYVGTQGVLVRDASAENCG